MKVLVDVGDNKLLNKLKSMSASMTLEVEAAVAGGASEVRNTMIDSMTQEPKTGRVYRVPGTKKATYVASAPGEAPAVATGNLLSSIDVEFSHRGLVADIGVLRMADADYAAYLEFGVPGKLEPRPFVAPALEANKKEIKENIDAAVKKVLKNG